MNMCTQTKNLNINSKHLALKIRPEIDLAEKKLKILKKKTNKQTKQTKQNKTENCVKSW